MHISIHYIPRYLTELPADEILALMEATYGNEVSVAFVPMTESELGEFAGPQSETHISQYPHVATIMESETGKRRTDLEALTRPNSPALRDQLDIEKLVGSDTEIEGK